MVGHECGGSLSVDMGGALLSVSKEFQGLVHLSKLDYRM
jgi:hypothetical protein